MFFVQQESEAVQEVVRRIVAESQPERVLLFGSRARGTAHEGSDIDLLVIARSALPRHERAAPLYGVLSDIPTAMDIVVYCPEEVDEWRDVPQSFVSTALREGVLLYERPAT